MDHAVVECTRCGMHLPLKRDLPADDPPTEWVCVNCGWQMPGVLDPDARDTILENVCPAETPKGEVIDQASRDTEPYSSISRFLSEYLQTAK